MKMAYPVPAHQVTRGSVLQLSARKKLKEHNIILLKYNILCFNHHLIIALFLQYHVQKSKPKDRYIGFNLQTALAAVSFDALMQPYPHQYLWIYELSLQLSAPACPFSSPASRL